MGYNQADIALIGLAVMGQNLVLNMADHGYQVVVFNRTVSKVDDFITTYAHPRVIGAHSIQELIQTLKTPRKIVMMVKAGPAVDALIDELLPFLEPGDILIDGGNSYFADTNARCTKLEQKGLYFIGAGISGGEEGARHGPSIMPGGHEKAWPYVQEILQSIAAQVDNKPCCGWVGHQGAGHYVKMVHNGIEYGDIQLICEATALMKHIGLSYEQIAETFAQWNQRELDSYLIEITSHIFAKKDSDGTFILDHILDVAGQKGTGKWSVIEGLNLSAPITLIAEAVFARMTSTLKQERIKAAKLFPYQGKQQKIDTKAFVEKIFYALYASKIISYAQGYMLLQQAAHTYGWKLAYGAIASMWRGGCIIRSQFLTKIQEAFDRNSNLENLLMDPFFATQIQQAQESFREVVSYAVLQGIAIPCLSNALSFYDSYRTEYCSANLLQALRDYFGAHMYERVDRPRGEFFHTNWTGTGGHTASTAYNA